MPSPQSQLTPADKQLLDRLFPAIIQRIDGKTLLDKIDPKTLANKVLPYLDISTTVNRQKQQLQQPPAQRPAGPIVR